MRRSRLRSQCCRARPRRRRSRAFNTAAAPIRGVPLRGDLKEIPQEQMAMLGSDAFRMKLHAVNRKPLVGKSHDQSVVGIRSRSELGRQAFALNHERMITRGFERRIDAAKNPAAVVTDFGKLAVDRPGRAHDLAAKRLADRLVAEADAENRNVAAGSLDEIEANAGLFRRAGTRR